LKKVTAGPRRRAREVAFRVAYQADATGDGFAETWRLRRPEEKLNPDQVELVDDVIRHLERAGAEVDSELSQAARNWKLERLSATDRSVLRVAVAELMCRTGTPARVILDEAIDLARTYGSDESGRFVNGVLDTLARRVRPGEL
jgi:N utilization substance protein B